MQLSCSSSVLLSGEAVEKGWVLIQCWVLIHCCSAPGSCCLPPTVSEGCPTALLPHLRPTPPTCHSCSISAQPELKPLRVALAAFLRRSVGPWLAAKQPGAGGLSAEQLGELLRRLRGAERALGSAAA